MKSVACGRYIIKQKLGAGSFGEIYRGEDKETGQSVAIKFEPAKTRVPQLCYESKLYNIFRNGVNVPKFYWYGTENNYNEMVVELLGKSLEDLAGQFPHHRLSLKTVLMLADQMLSAVQYLHLMNFIHRDIKPDNFIMGIGKNSNKVMVIDFGLSKKYRDPHSHQHIKYTEHKDLTGTARYASLAALKGIEQSRRDDLEALGFVWLYLLRGDLPWMGLDANNRRQKYDKICQVKAETTFESLCNGFPEEFVRYFYNVRSLRFVDEPDYSHFRKMFRKLFMKLGYIYDYSYDWTATPIRRSNNRPVSAHLDQVNNPKKQQAEFLSDREKRPRLPIPTAPQNQQQSKSRRGANEQIKLKRSPYYETNYNTLNLSVIPQQSNKGENEFKNEIYMNESSRPNDYLEQKLRKDEIKKSKAWGKSEAEAYARMPIHKPRLELFRSTSSSDGDQLKALINASRNNNPNSARRQNSSRNISDAEMIRNIKMSTPQPTHKLQKGNRVNSNAIPHHRLEIPRQAEDFNSSYSDDEITAHNRHNTETPNRTAINMNKVPITRSNSHNLNNIDNYSYFSYSDDDTIETNRRNPPKHINRTENVKNERNQKKSPGRSDDYQLDKHYRRNSDAPSPKQGYVMQTPTRKLLNNSKPLPQKPSIPNSAQQPKSSKQKTADNDYDYDMKKKQHNNDASLSDQQEMHHQKKHHSNNSSFEENDAPHTQEIFDRNLRSTRPDLKTNSKSSPSLPTPTRTKHSNTVNNIPPPNLHDQLVNEPEKENSSSSDDFMFEKIKAPINSKTPQRSSYLPPQHGNDPQRQKLNSPRGNPPNKHIPNKNTDHPKLGETPERMRNKFASKNHTEVPRDRRLPFGELSESSESSSIDDSLYSKNRRNNSKHARKSVDEKNQNSDRGKDVRRSQDMTNKAGMPFSKMSPRANETDIGTLQRIRIPRNTDSNRRDKDPHRSDEDNEASNNLGSPRIGKKSDGTSKSPGNTRPIPRPNITQRNRKTLVNAQKRHSLRPNAMIPNWMNEKFKGRK